MFTVSFMLGVFNSIQIYHKILNIDLNNLSIVKIYINDYAVSINDCIAS